MWRVGHVIEPVMEIPAHSQDINSMVMSNKLIISSSNDNKVKIWNIVI